MITTSQVAPSPLLAPFVKSYVYREFDTQGVDVVKPKHAIHELAMHFFFQGLPVKLTDPATGAILKTGKRSGVSGLSSQYVGEMTFNGFYSFFEVVYKPHGFQALFSIPASSVLNQIAWSEELFDPSIEFLHEQLCYCSHVQQMGIVCDAYLLNRLQKQNNKQERSRISYIINSINRKYGAIDIDSIARDVNMSVRNFERHFIDNIGIPAKLYCCIARFNYALDTKLRNPQLRWTDIAHQSGYFDQTHLIKDFKKFCGEAPSVLLKETPLLVETYIGEA